MKEFTIRPSAAIGLCMLFGGAFAFILLLILNGMIVNFDSSIIEAIQGLEAAWLTSIMHAFTFIGSTIVVILLTIAMTVLLIWKFGAGSRGYFFIITILATILLFHALKFIFQRDRPEFNRLAEADGHSFPSGHAMMGVSLYALTTLLLWRHVQSTAGRIALVAFAVFMVGTISLSRVYLGVHYPSDVIGGWFASALFITLAALIFNLMEKRKE